MSSGDHGDTLDHLEKFLHLLERARAMLGGMVSSRAAQFIAFERREVRRAASVFALAFTAAIMTCAAAGFAAVAVLAALGDAHRAAGAAFIALGLALIALCAALLVRGSAGRD
jgi:hypothetical protein